MAQHKRIVNVQINYIPSSFFYEAKIYFYQMMNSSLDKKAAVSS